MPKSKYETHVKPRLQEIEAWSRDGLTLDQIAKNLGVARSSIMLYKKQHSDFSDILTRTKDYVDNVSVTNALLQRAMGYTIPLKKVKYKYVEVDGSVVKVPVEEEIEEKHFPGDPGLLKWWLSIRQRHRWTIIDEEKEESDEAGVVVIPMREVLDEGDQNG